MRFLSGLLIIVIGFLLQLILVYQGTSPDFIFAALIAFAGCFAFEEMLFFIACSAFLLMWRPAIDLPLAVVLLYPCAVYFLQRFFRWEGWFGFMLLLVLGSLLLAFVEYPGSIVRFPNAFATDLLMSMAFGAAAYSLVKAS